MVSVQLNSLFEPALPHVLTVCKNHVVAEQFHHQGRFPVPLWLVMPRPCSLLMQLSIFDSGEASLGSLEKYVDVRVRCPDFLGCLQHPRVLPGPGSHSRQADLPKWHHPCHPRNA